MKAITLARTSPLRPRQKTSRVSKNLEVGLTPEIDLTLARTSPLRATQKNKGSGLTSSKHSQNQTISSHAKSYVYLGHGEELSLVNNRTVNNGTLSTITETGLVSMNFATYNLCTIAEYSKYMLNNPLEHKSKLNWLFHGNNAPSDFKKVLSVGHYKLKIKGDEYKDKHCDFLDKMYLNTPIYNISIGRSGLYEINTKDLHLPRLAKEGIEDTHRIYLHDNGTITIAQIKQIYDRSVYPTTIDIIDHIIQYYGLQEIDDNYAIPYTIFENIIKNLTLLTVSELMIRFIGNHYFFVCRYFTRLKFSNYKTINQERKRSRNVENKLVNMTVMGSDYFTRRIHKLYLLLHRELNHSASISYATMFLEFKFVLNKYIKHKGRVGHNIIDFVRSTMNSINKGIAKKEFTEEDISIVDNDFLTLFNTIKHSNFYKSQRTTASA